MSMMISTTLCAIKQCSKQAQGNINPFTDVLLLVGDLAQLFAICRHFLKKNELYCNICHVSLAPCWSMATHHVLIGSIKHSINPIFLQFLNNICFKQPTQNEIDKVLSSCYVSEKDLLSHIDYGTNILCSHQEDVKKCNDLLIHKIFLSNEIFDVTMETDALDIENVKIGLHDPKFNHIKYVAIGTIVMLTENINISKELQMEPLL